MNYKHYYAYPKYSESEKTYYANITGAEDLGMISAASLDDFEKLFHQRIDDHIEETHMKSHKRYLGWLLAIGCIVILLATMAITCPDKESHSEVVSARLAEALSEGDSDDFDLLESLFETPLIKAAVNNYFTVDNYVLFSLGRINISGKGQVISAGILGHVFAPSKQMILDKVKNDENVQNILEW